MDRNGNLSAAAALANIFRQLFLGTEKKGEDVKHQGAAVPPEGSGPPAATLPRSAVGSCSEQL